MSLITLEWYSARSYFAVCLDRDRKDWFLVHFHFHLFICLFCLLISKGEEEKKTNFHYTVKKEKPQKVLRQSQFDSLLSFNVCKAFLPEQPGRAHIAPRTAWPGLWPIWPFSPWSLPVNKAVGMLWRQ